MSVLNLKERDHGIEHFLNLPDKGIPFQGTSITIFLNHSASQNKAWEFT